jgi:hypothetical protein
MKEGGEWKQETKKGREKGKSLIFIVSTDCRILTWKDFPLSAVTIL